MRNSFVSIRHINMYSKIRESPQRTISIIAAQYIRVDCMIQLTIAIRQSLQQVTRIIYVGGQKTGSWTHGKMTSDTNPKSTDLRNSRVRIQFTIMMISIFRMSPTHSETIHTQLNTRRTINYCSCCWFGAWKYHERSESKRMREQKSTNTIGLERLCGGSGFIFIFLYEFHAKCETSPTHLHPPALSFRSYSLDSSLIFKSHIVIINHLWKITWNFLFCAHTQSEHWEITAISWVILFCGRFSPLRLLLRMCDFVLCSVSVYVINDDGSNEKCTHTHSHSEGRNPDF